MKSTKKKPGKKRPQRFPPGWNEKRVRKLIGYYDRLDDDEWLAQDEAARRATTLMEIPTKLVPTVRQLIKRYQKTG